MAHIAEKTLKSGRLSYEARVVRAGLPFTSKSFGSRREAEKWARLTETKIDQGKQHKEYGKELFEEVVEQYKRAKSPTGNELQMSTALSGMLAGFAIRELNNERLRKFVDAMHTIPIPAPSNKKVQTEVIKHYAPSTIRKYFIQLRTIIKWHASKENYELSGNLFFDIDVPGAWSKPRERRLEDGEWEKLLIGLKTGLKHNKIYPIFIELFLETALRSQELLTLQWKYVDYKNRDLQILEEHVKTKRFRAVPMSKRTIALLEELSALKPHKSDDLLFGEWKDSDTLAKSFGRAVKRAGLKDFTIHDLRHEAVSRLFEKGTLSDIEIMKIVGHTNFNTLSRYFKQRSTHLADKMG